MDSKQTSEKQVQSLARVAKKLIICFDGKCPMCIAEMQHLKQRDSRNEIHLVDIHEKANMAIYPQIQFDAAMGVLHGIYDGKF